MAKDKLKATAKDKTRKPKSTMLGAGLARIAADKSTTRNKKIEAIAKELEK